MKNLLAIATIFICVSTLPAETSYHRPPGMPQDELVAFDNFKADQETATIAALLGVRSFRWMLQIPEDAQGVAVTISEIDTDSQKEDEIARMAFNPIPVDPSKREDRSTFFPVILTIMPDDTKSDEPWKTSWSFLGILEIPDLNILIRRSYPNPFRRTTGSVSFFNTTRIATPIERKPGMWDGFGTSFDIMARGDGDRYVLRVAFSASPIAGQ
jgi:hypothetical protein